MLSNKDKKRLWLKKQQKAIKQEQIREHFEEESHKRDMAFIEKQTGLVKDKTNKKLKELHNMKKQALIIRRNLSKELDKETKDTLKENLLKSNERGKEQIVTVENSVMAFSAYTERQEKLVTDCKLFGIDTTILETLTEKANDILDNMVLISEETESPAQRVDSFKKALEETEKPQETESPKPQEENKEETEKPQAPNKPNKAKSKPQENK